MLWLGNRPDYVSPPRVTMWRSLYGSKIDVTCSLEVPGLSYEEFIRLYDIGCYLIN